MLIQTKIETLEQLLDNERYLKTQIIDTNNQIKYLIRINKDLQKSNEQLIKTIIKQDNDIEEQLNNDINIKQLLKLKIQ
jgi:hypothetical protein